jgi:hypothetical protein
VTRTENARETARVSEPLRKLVAGAVADVPDIKLVYLFGSWVEGDVGLIDVPGVLTQWVPAVRI